MTTNDPPQCLCFPFKGYTCCKLSPFVREKPQVRHGHGASQSITQRPVRKPPHVSSAPTAARRAPWKSLAQTSHLQVGGDACSCWEPLQVICS